jgi:hypothetical protein
LPGTNLPFEEARHVAGHDLAPVWPFARRQPEDVGQAVVAHVPALGQPGLDLPRTVEPDEPLGEVHAQHRLRLAGGWRKRITEHQRPGPNHRHGKRIVLALAATTEHQCGASERKRQMDKQRGATQRHSAGTLSQLHRSSTTGYCHRTVLLD